MAEQRQALRDDLGRKEGAHILNIMRWADSIRVNRNDIETGKAACPRAPTGRRGLATECRETFGLSKLPAPSGEYLQHADEEL